MNQKSKKSSSPSPSLTTRIVRQARRYQLTTASIVTSTLAGGNRRKAKERLQRLVADTRLFQHPLTGLNGGMLEYYFTLTPRPLMPTVARVCHALLGYCEIEKPNRTLLSTNKINRLVEGMCDSKQYRKNLQAHIVVEPTRGVVTPRIEMIRVSRRQTPTGIDVGAVHSRISELIEQSDFVPWWHFARAERFVLTYLVAGSENVAALCKHFEQRPLLSRIGGTAVSIPIGIKEARQFSNRDL